MTDDNKDDTMEDVEVQEEPSSPTEGGMNVHVGKLHISDIQLPFVGMFFTGLILLIAILIPGRSLKFWAYGIALASVAMVMALVGFGLTFSESANNSVGKFNAYFLFLWCFVGACIMTFIDPFTSTSNGYFASWGLAVCSIVGVGVTGSEAKSVVGKMGALLGLGACAIVVLIAIIAPLRGTGDSTIRNICIYTLVVACVTIPIVAVFQKCGEKFQKLKFFTLAFFSILWIVLAAMVTFKGPFRDTSNGYFGSWGGAITSVIAAMAALRE